MGTRRSVKAQPANLDVASVEVARVELGRMRLLARAWAETVPEGQRVGKAATFARRALEALAAEAAPLLVPGAPFATPRSLLDPAALRLAVGIGTAAAALPVIEGLHTVTGLYPALLPGSTRSALGAFYTPPALTQRLLDQVTAEGLDWRTARILDPAAGGGAFLLQAAQRLRAALGPCEPAFAIQQIAARLLGLELDPHAAGLAQGALEILLADLTVAAGRPAPVLVRVCDALEETPGESFDLVIGNPPYGRITLTPDQRRRYARSLYGHANLYGVFTDVALRWAKADGFIAYLTPTSFLAGQYYAALRRLLAGHAPPVAIDFVHARRGVFENVLQETMLAIYRKGAGPRRAQVHYLHVTSESEAQVTRNGTIGLPADGAAPWLAPRDPAHSALIARVESMPARLADWGYGVSTGPLVWNRFKPQLRDRPGGKATYPLIWAEAVTADGQFIFRAQKRNHAPYFKLEAGDEWLLVDRPCVLLQRTTAKEQARRLIAAELPADFIQAHGGVVVENHLNMIHPTGKPQVPPAVVAAILNSRIVDQVFRCMNGSVAVSAFELESLPLPGLADLAILRKLVAAGAAPDRIEAECHRLYGGEAG
jgi:adenine-specific DNA-methyltransferase